MKLTLGLFGNNINVALYVCNTHASNPDTESLNVFIDIHCMNCYLWLVLRLSRAAVLLTPACVSGSFSD